MSKKRLYLDVCALCRPFDNQAYLRIALETEAVNLILSMVKKGIYEMIVSNVHIKEIESIEDNLERIHLLTLLERFGTKAEIDPRSARARAEALIKLGFGVADAAHVAIAEQVGADFISCDLKLLKKCSRHKIKIWCGSPVMFCEKEVLK